MIGVLEEDDREIIFPSLVTVAMRRLLDRLARLRSEEFDNLMAELRNADDTDLEAVSKRLFRR